MLRLWLLWFGKDLSQPEPIPQAGIDRVVELMNRLLDVTPATLDVEIDAVLATIGQAYGFDRTFVFRFDEAQGYVNTHEWVAPGVPPQKGKLSAGQSATKAVNRRLLFGEKAVFAVIGTLLSVMLGVAILWGFFAWHGVPFTLENLILIMSGGDAIPASEIRQIMAWVIPAVLMVYVLITYFGAAMGSRNQIKLQERLATKGR